jgi:type IV pilus assembly protein PilN
MIEINLLPGAARKTKGRGTGFSLVAVAAGVRARVKDPFMLSAAASVLVAAGAVGLLYFSQTAKAADLGVREQKAVADSVRFATVLREHRRAAAKRDSVLRQLQVIRAIDDDRFVWPHIMDEVSRALPPYTWLKSLAAVTAVATPVAAPAAGAAASKDPTPEAEPPRFRIVGNTVDIQALTRFMKLLETSPFIQNVQLTRSQLAMVDGKEVTEFQLEAQYERPDKSALMTAPVSLSVR